MNTLPDPLDSIPLLNLTESGQAPPERLSRASSLRSIFMRAREDDDVAAKNRLYTQDLLDNGTPWDQAVLDANGQTDMPNLNFGGAEQQCERAKAPYYRMVRDTHPMLQVFTTYGPEDERPGWNEILAEELTRTIRNWEEFTSQTDRLIHKFIWDGVGIMHWPDTLDWRYRGNGLGQFYFPRRSGISEGGMEIVTYLEEYTVTRLFRAIQNRESAAAEGWNVPAVLRAIRHATAADPIYQDWERLQEDVKNNDLGVANQTPVIRVVGGYVKEFNGKVSHYLTTETPCGNDEEFLFKARNAYHAMKEGLVIFPYGNGTNTLLHSVRGLGFKIFGFEQQRNRSLCRLIAQGDLASSLMLQAPDEESLANVGLQYYGNTAVIDPDCKVVQYAAPDLQRTVMPVLNEMERLRNDRVGSYTSDNVFDGDQRKTKFEISAALEQNAQLSDTELDFWNGPFTRGMQQTVRRMIRRTYVSQDPGGHEIAAMKLRLVKRGVPLEALYMIDVEATQVVEAIGGGSASSKTLALGRISELRPRMDDVGQAALDRALAIDAVGVSYANVFFAPDNVRRTTVDTSIAILQNAQLLQGIEVPVLPSDKHLAHAREHMKPLLDIFTAVEQGQLPIEEGAMRGQLLYNHCAEHVDVVSGDPAAIEEAAMLRQFLQQVGEVISNGLKKAQNDAAEAQQEGGEGGGQPGPDPKMVAEFERHKAKMQFAKEAHDLKLQQMLEDAATKRAIADAEGAARIAREGLKPRKPPTQ